ncbi:hypothetical protein HGRIS_009632 [Hohenbuehelia grisea]|uniref:CBM1 domain-containing protein n=1 Tax=Hohenbuehelia grisea TaxID=104357 RepID=A0ABR3J269_9AGAR
MKAQLAFALLTLASSAAAKPFIPAQPAIVARTAPWNPNGTVSDVISIARPTVTLTPTATITSSGTINPTGQCWTTTITRYDAPPPTPKIGVPNWGQCGGIGWTGATACLKSYYCYKYNEYYSQCIPDPNPPTSTPAFPPVVTATVCS